MPPDMGRIHPALYAAARQRFGSYTAALKAAGVKGAAYRTGRSYNRELIVQLLKQIHPNGEALSFSSIKAVDYNLAQAAYKHFGSYSAAAEAAGLPFEVRTRETAMGKWTGESLLKALRDMHANGGDLRHATISTKHHVLYWQARKLFGSYAIAVREAGINYWTMSQAQLALQRSRAAERLRDEDSEGA
jgi:hypothetical protein